MTLKSVLCAASASVVLASGAAVSGAWLYRADVGTGGTDWTDWHDTGNWVDGAVAKSGGDADLTAAANQYVNITNAISVGNLKGSADEPTVLRSDRTVTVEFPDSTHSFKNVHLYAPFVTSNKNEYTSGPGGGVMFCGPYDGTDQPGIPQFSGRNEFRFDRYALSADAARTQTIWRKRMDINNGASLHFVAPRGSAETVGTWSQTSGSPFLKRAEGQTEHALSAGTTVTGAGIPAGTFLKRVFPDGTIELSAAATATEVANKLTFAAFRPQMCAYAGSGGGWQNGKGNHRFYIEKYREEDDFTVSFSLFTVTGGDDNALYQVSTREGFVPGTFKLTALSNYAKLTLDDSHLLLAGAAASTHVFVPDATKTARVTVEADQTYGFASLDQLVGTFVKDGAGTLTFAFPSDAKTKLTGTLVVEEGTLSPIAAEGAVNYVKNLTIKSGATFVVPASGFACDVLTAEEGAILSGSGPVTVGNLTSDLAKKLILRGGTYFSDAESETEPLSFEILNGTARSAAQDGDSVLVFSSNSLVRVHGTGSLTMLLVGGGGGGGSKQGGGGGGGGVLYTNLTLKSGIYAVTVGLGGKGAPNKTTLSTSGGNSSFSGCCAVGGGAGGTFGGGKRNGKTSYYGVDGGSGGGGGVEYPWTSTSAYAGGAGVVGQGHDGGHGQNVKHPNNQNSSVQFCCGGGGGGAGAPGEAPTVLRNANNMPTNVVGACGGDGVLCTILGARYYGGGGGGAGTAYALSTACRGGLGGGGNGARSYSATVAGGKGTDGLGGGGGGGSGYNAEGGGGPGGDGGSGIVIFRWRETAKPQPAENLLATGGKVRRHGGYAIHTFTSDDTFTLSEDALVDILLVGGGGGGGARGGGGGGAGGVVVLSNAFLKAGAHAVTVGTGGAGATDPGFAPKSGSNTSFAVGEGLIQIAYGGGGGGSSSMAGQNGASSGGGGAPYVLNSALTCPPGTCPFESAGQGNVGGVGVHKYTQNINNDRYTAMAGGGGGASVPGGSGDADAKTPGNGGDGIWNDFSGKDVCYGGGGGGGAAVYLYGRTFIAKGGEGGGGGGGGILSDYPNCSNGLDGVDGLGGGGGGGGGVADGSGSGGRGGNGIVIIRYQAKPLGLMLIVR